MVSVVGPVSLFVLLVFVDSSNIGCPEGYKFGKHGKSASCYLFSRKQLNWNQAKEFCSKNDAHLVVIDDAGEDEYIRNYLKKHETGDIKWIAANDLLIEGQWAWELNGTRQEFTYTNWGPKQPDNFHNEEDCAQLSKHTNYMWDDRKCDEKEEFICEYTDDTLSVVNEMWADAYKN